MQDRFYSHEEGDLLKSVEQIDLAIEAHSLWKKRLRTAIETRQSDWMPRDVRSDTDCDFGKWLFHEISSDLKDSKSYQTIIKLHAEFHTEAARILEIALSGKKAEAQDGMEVISDFSIFSARLVGALWDWKDQILYGKLQ